jgi:hypothetical protein
MAIAAPGWALGRVLEARAGDCNPEKKGSIHSFCDKGLHKNELRAIVRKRPADHISTAPN